ncbi:MAG TPA: hypothetical protein PKL92_00355 [Aquaticitalea sp.]|nr:hypothetical protein [Aquaticitalea sp.]HNU58928.1 hypothetical protein [Aquaticitalea sp.]
MESCRSGAYRQAGVPGDSFGRVDIEVEVQVYDLEFAACLRKL